MISIVDYGRGNIFSIGQALHHIGVEFEIVRDADAIRRAERVILPGVGAFGDAMKNLHEQGLVGPIRDFAASGRILVGICLGMQLLAETSAEFGQHNGLGLIPGDVRRLPSGPDRIPNVGWRRVETTLPPHEANIASGEYFYFVHSYHFVCHDPAHVALVMHLNNTSVTGVVWNKNLRGAQFHPEKSGAGGLKLLARMLEE